MIKNILFAAGGVTPIVAPRLVGYTTHQESLVEGDGNFVIAHPTGTAAGDQLIAFVATPGQDIWESTGWTRVARSYPDIPELEVFTKVATTTGDITFTSATTGATTVSAIIVAYRDAAYTAVSAMVIDTESATTIPSMTATVDYTDLLLVVAHEESAAITPQNGNWAVLANAGAAAPALKVYRTTVRSGASGTSVLVYTPSPGNLALAVVQIDPA